MEVQSVFAPIVTIIGSVFLPFMISGFLFYICLPFQSILEKWGFLTPEALAAVGAELVAISEAIEELETEEA